MAKKPEKNKTVETLTHEEASRKNIPTAEFQSVLQKEHQSPIRVAYERRKAFCVINDRSSEMMDDKFERPLLQGSCFKAFMKFTSLVHCICK